MLRRLLQTGEHEHIPYHVKLIPEISEHLVSSVPGTYQCVDGIDAGIMEYTGLAECCPRQLVIPFRGGRLVVLF